MFTTRTTVIRATMWSDPLPPGLGRPEYRTVLVQGRTVLSDISPWSQGSHWFSLPQITALACLLDKITLDRGHALVIMTIHYSASTKMQNCHPTNIPDWWQGPSYVYNM